jgi:uncharacterized protein
MMARELLREAEMSEVARPDVPRDEPDRHEVSAKAMAELAAGYGGAAAIVELRAAQTSVARMVLAAAVGTTRPVPQDAWELITRLDEEAPEAVESVLRHPFVRAWAADLLAPADGDGFAAPDELSGIAAAMAFRAGAEVELRVPILDGAVHLPSLGRMVVASGGRKATVRIGADGRLTVITSEAAVTAGPRVPAWQPVRVLKADGLTVTCEDTDRHRDGFGWPASPRLTGDELAARQDALDGAWEHIRGQYAAYAPGIAAGLSCLVPLVPAPEGALRSGTIRQAFGAVGAVRPGDPEMLALLLIHEFQHNKLGAVLDMYELHDPDDDRRFTVTWRPDPRPISGVLQGVYAHLGVTDFWRLRRRTALTPRARELAAAEFARWRDGTAAAIDTLAESAALTELGTWFTARMADTIGPWLAEPVL